MNKLTKLEKITLKMMKINKFQKIGRIKNNEINKEIEIWTNENIEMAKVILKEFEKIKK